MFQKIVLAIGILVAGYISIRALIVPEDVLSSFGLIVDGADGRNEIRGQYGGFFGAVAVTLILSVVRRLPERFGLGVLLMTVGGVLIGRLLSIVIEGPGVIADYSSGIKTFMVFDIVIVVLTLAALHQSKGTD